MHHLHVLNPDRLAVLEVILSSLDRQLVIPPDQLRAPPAPPAGTGTVRSRLQQHVARHQRALSAAAAPPLLPGGLSPGHAGPEEWAAAAAALAGVCILHGKTRAVLATAQYLQV
jgi:hypothetical protein